VAQFRDASSTENCSVRVVGFVARPRLCVLSFVDTFAPAVMSGGRTHCRSGTRRTRWSGL